MRQLDTFWIVRVWGGPNAPIPDSNVLRWTNKPVAPIDDPSQMFSKLYGGARQRQVLASVLDLVQEDLHRIERVISSEDRRLWMNTCIRSDDWNRISLRLHPSPS